MKRPFKIIAWGVVLLIFVTSSSWPQDFWEQTNGPFGGNVIQLETSDNGQVFAILDGKDIYRLNEQSDSWVKIELAFSFDYPIHFASHYSNIVLANYNSIYSSKDNGLSWTQTRLNYDCIFLALAFESQGILYGYDGRKGIILASADNGYTWYNPHFESFGICNIYSLMFLTEGPLWVGSNWGLGSFNVDSRHWTISGQQIAPIMAFDEGADSFVYVGTAKGLFRRTAADTNLSTILSNKVISKVKIADNGHIWALTDSARLYYSNDAGVNWSYYRELESVSSFTLAGTHTILAGSPLDGIWRSDDGGAHWAIANTGMRSSRINPTALAINSLGDVFAASGKRIFRSGDHGRNWKQLKTPLEYGLVKSIAISSTDLVAVGTEAGHVCFSSDAGEAWRDQHISLTFNTVVHAIAFDESNRIFAATDSGLFCSSDNGLTWISTNLGIRIAKVATRDHGQIFAGTRDGSLLRSTDGGATWRELLTAEGWWHSIMALLILPNNRILLSRYSSGEGDRDIFEFLQSDDNGDSWTVTQSTYPYGITDLLANKQGVLFAAAFSAIQYSIDNGKTWQGMGDLQSRVTALACDSCGNVYAGTSNRGVYHYRSSLVALKSEKLIQNADLKSYGCNWVDYDSDGWQDIFIANNGANAIFHNDGKGVFSPMTNGELVNASEPSRGAAWGDYNNDGFADVFIANENAPNSLYKNNGDGTFTKITDGKAVISTGAHRAAAWADYDRDGFIDLFVVTRSGLNALYHNNGDGTLSAVTNNVVVSDSSESYGCAWGDCDSDGDPDLFVANYGNNFLYQNNSDGTFIKVTVGPIVNDGGKSFGGSWGDYDNDGHLDLLVTNTDGPNFLYHNGGRGKFTRVTAGEIVTDSGVSKGSAWADINNDGYLDLYAVRNGKDAVYLNDGKGTFIKLNASYFNEEDNTLACAIGDANNDGFPDLLRANYGVPSKLLLNNGNSNQWLSIRCLGTTSNRLAIGATIRVKATINGKSFWQMREISSQSGHSSQNSLQTTFGLGDATMVDSLMVRWPSGMTEYKTNVVGDRTLTLIEGSVTSVVDAFGSGDVVPAKFALEQNYPNPFNPQTTIIFQLPKAVATRISIYNMLGQEVKRILDRQMEPGYHEVIWDGLNEAGMPVGSGVYYYRIEAGEFKDTKKMAMLR